MAGHVEWSIEKSLCARRWPIRPQQIVEELRGVNAKLESLDEKLDTIHTDMNAGFTTLAGLMRQMLERLDRVVDRAKGVRRV